MNTEYELNEKQIQIKRWINRLDQVAISYEAKWGLGKLPELITPGLRIKWDAQMHRLNTAIQNGELTNIAEMVEGTIRGWGKLEEDALAQGHKPHDAEYWEVAHEDFAYRIYKNNIDALAPCPAGVVRYSIKEIARILHDYQLVNKVKDTIGGELVSIEKDKRKAHSVEDDVIPW